MNCALLRTTVQPYNNDTYTMYCPLINGWIYVHYILTCMPSFAFFQISHTFASITALLFLNVKKLSDVTVMSVKKVLTQLGVTVPKGQSYGKESLVILLGKELFGKEKG